MNVKAIIFDMDGTLVDTEALHHHSWNITVKHFGTDDDHIDSNEYGNYVGKDGYPIAAMVVETRPHILAPLGQIADKKKQIFIDNVRGNVKLIDGADIVLARCKELGLRIAVATGGNRESTEIKMLESEINHYFEHVVTATEVENKKPHPQTYIDAYSGLGVEPEFCVAVEDTEAGVNSAVDAGIYCIAKPTIAGVGHDFSKANIVVGSLLEAMDHIEKLMQES